jgi:hypothetical protein
MGEQGSEERVRFTFAPCFVEGDDLVDELDRSGAPALGLADEVRVSALVGAEEVDVEHRLRRPATVCGGGGGRGGLERVGGVEQ